jgi:hypothetical protein
MVISKRLRWLAGLAGGTTILGGFVGWPPFFLFSPIPLIVGACIDEREPHLGHLISWGAGINSLLVIPFDVGMIYDGVTSRTLFADSGFLLIDSLVLITLLTTLSCDVGLVIAAVKSNARASCS